MKKDKETCKKGHESTIGKIIYGFLLFLPLLAIGITCGYAMFNKNAYQSYSSSQSPNTYLSEDSITNLTKNKVYQFTTNNQFYLAENQIINVNQIVIIKSPNGYTGLNKTASAFEQYVNQNGHFLHIKYSDNSNDYLKYANLEYTYIAEIQFNFVPNQNYNNYKYTNWTKEIIFGTQQSIDNVFYYSIDKVENSILFNWAENSIIYTGMSNFTTALSISNTFIPLLLTYWLVISIVYFLYDIVLVMLNVLHRKVHELQDSI